MDDKNKIEVLIGGKVYTLVGIESDEYMQRIALYIDKKMNEIRKTDLSKKLSTNAIAILTSINVADDLFKVKKDCENELNDIAKYKTRLKELNEELEKYQNELGEVQKEALEYQSLFEESQLEVLRYKSELQNMKTKYESKLN